jgi:F-type H+-transporting ATPase subunit alpha
MKQVAGSLRLDLAQYRELAAFAQFGSDLDVSTQKQLARGERLTEVLKQDQYEPLRVSQQICIIFAGTAGFFDDLAVAQVREFEKGFYEYVGVNDPQLWDDIESAGKLDEALEGRLTTTLEEFKAQAFGDVLAAVDEDVAGAAANEPEEAEAEETADPVAADED